MRLSRDILSSDALFRNIICIDAPKQGYVVAVMRLSRDILRRDAQSRDVLHSDAPKKGYLVP